MMRRRAILLNTLIRSSRYFRYQSPQLRMASTIPKLSIFDAISRHDPHSTAIIHSKSRRSFPYGGIISDVADAKGKLQEIAGPQKLDGQRIAFLTENSYDYVGAGEREF